VQDGWDIKFTEFVVAISEVSLEGDEQVEIPGSYVFDLARLSGGEGHLLADIPGVETGSYSVVQYRFERPTEVVGGNATDAQIEHLTAKGTALHVVGQATRGTSASGSTLTSRSRSRTAARSTNASGPTVAAAPR
jgi:hypothetical protein